MFAEDMIFTLPYEFREEGLDIKGVIPAVSERFGVASKALNERITEVIETKIASAKETKARSIHFSFELYVSRRAVSIIVLSTVTSASSKMEAVSINFNPSGGAKVTLSEAVGYDITPLAKKLLNEMMLRSPERFINPLEQLSKSQAFYLTRDRLILVFDEFQLTKSSEGLTRFEIFLGRVEFVEVSKADYYEWTEYMVKMIPLRQVCVDLGYEIFWQNAERRVDLLQNESIFMSLFLGLNSYAANANKHRTLEAAPVMRGGIVYVPISFFDQILTLVTYSIDEESNITFYSYRE